MILHLEKWKASGWQPFTPILGNAAETGLANGRLTRDFEARVPGSLYEDLRRAGYLPDPYFERNSFLCEWVKDRFWVCRTEFTLPESEKGRRITLTLDGAETKAHLQVNGVKLGEHENAFVPYTVDISGIVRFGEPNSVGIILENAPDEMSQIGYTERMHTQKPRYTYGWDFCTRLPAMGIRGSVTVRTSGSTRIADTHARYADGGFSYHARFDTDRPVTVKFTFSFGGKTLFEEEKEAEGGYEVNFPVPEPHLWYPNGEGAQPLYALSLTVLENGEESDRKDERVGLRTLTYRTCDGAEEGSLPYIPVVNGRPVFIKGVNCVPTDLMTGLGTKERTEKMLRLVRDGGFNLVRVWGGGVIESEYFYDLCDEYGIMIWQEFPQSSSGISNVPSKDPHYLSLLAMTAEYAVPARRNHPSLTFWSGGNELTDARGVPSTFEDENLAMLLSIVSRLDPDRLMLPTSASGPTEYGLPDPKKNHDVHGPWKYCGVTAQYEHYNSSPILLHSEFGVDGMTNPAMLPTFLSEENRKSVPRLSENEVWRHHGEWWETAYSRDYPLFGDYSDDIEKTIAISQYIQAEGLRCALEANRRRAFACAGSIVWQLNEPWPGFSGTNLIDFSLTPKLAYWFCRDAVRPFHVSLRCGSLVWRKNAVFSAKAFLHDEKRAHPEASVQLTVLDESGKPAAEGEWEISLPVSDLGRTFRVVAEAKDGEETDRSEYLFFVLSDEYPLMDADAVVRYTDDYRKANGI